MSRVNQSHRATETQSQRDNGKSGQGEKEKNTLSPVPAISFSLSPCPLVYASLCLPVSVAILLIWFAVSCRQDMQDEPKYKPLAPSSFFSDGKSARQLV